MDVFVIVYIDDILIYSKMTKEYARHLDVVLKKLEDNEFYINGGKSKFAQ